MNALVYNDWTITEPQISMFSDRIEVLSHGGLPNGMTKKQFFEGISKPRNATLMRIFLSMGLVEHTGHGIPTIVERYGEEALEIETNYIKCTIKFDKDVMDKLNRTIVSEINTVQNETLKPSEEKVLKAILSNPDDTALRIAEKIGLSQRTVERALTRLQQVGKIERIGNKREGRWIVIK